MFIRLVFAPQVENEWRALVVLKREVAVPVLSQRLGKNTAQAKVESILEAEDQRQDELKNLRLKNIKLKMKVQKLEAALREEEQARQDPLEVQFEQLHVERLEMKKQAVKQSEESKKLQVKMRSGLEVGWRARRYRQGEGSGRALVILLIMLFSTLSGPDQRKGEAVLEPGGGAGQARGADRGWEHSSQEEGPSEQDQAGAQQPAEGQPEAVPAARTAGEQAAPARLWGHGGCLQIPGGTAGESEGHGGRDRLQVWQMAEKAGVNQVKEGLFPNTYSLSGKGSDRGMKMNSHNL